MHAGAPDIMLRAVFEVHHDAAHLGNVLLLLRLDVSLIELGEFFDVGEMVDLESVLGVEGVTVQRGDGKDRIIDIPELDEDESGEGSMGRVNGEGPERRTPCSFRSSGPRAQRYRRA